MTADDLRVMRDKIIRARAAGTRSVSHDGKSVTYATDAEMRAALADIEWRLRRAEGSAVTTIRITSSKGL